MTPEGADEAVDESNRVARGFEALVDEEALFPSTPPLTRPAPPASADAKGPASTGGATETSAPPSAAGPSPADGRLEQLEERVRETMDRLRDVVEAQLPTAVDGLRADLETLRVELQTTLEEATAQLAEERKQLRSQIAVTVGAANRWFVRTRDQLYERLDQIARVAGEAQAGGGARAGAAVSPAPRALEAGPEPPPALGRGEGIRDDIGEDIGEETGEAGDRAGGAADDGEIEVEFEVVERAGPDAPPTVSGPAGRTSGADALGKDLRELQAEVAELRATVDRIEKRMARSKPVKLDPSQIELIVEAVVLAFPAPAPAGVGSRSRAARAAADGDATAPTRARKAGSATKAGTTTAKAGTAGRARAATAASRTGTKAGTKAVKAPRVAKRAGKEPDASPSRGPFRSFI